MCEEGIAEEEEEEAADEADGSDEEEAMETDGKTADVPMETDATEGGGGPSEAKAKAEGKGGRRAPPSGLPHSREELEALVAAIHQTVNDSVLPRLHKCLTAKVRRRLKPFDLRKASCSA